MKKFLKIVVVIFLWCNTATAESELPPCLVGDSMKWTNCYGSYNDQDVTDYIKKKSPKMEELYPNSYFTENYDGEFGSQPGLKNGHGIRNLYLNDEIFSTYEGKFSNNQRNGFGVYANVKKNYKYIGNYKNGFRNGQGTLTDSDGTELAGVWKDNKFNGQGTHIWPDGVKYVGEFKDSKPHGQGTYIWPDGVKYVGEFKDGKEHGQGTYTYPDGQKFVGEFKDGKEHGQGTHTWPDGQKFVGEFKDGKENGQGTHTWPSGVKEVAVYKDGEIVKIVSSTVKKESSNSSSSSSSLTGYKHCKNVWGKLINIRDRYSKNSSDYYRLDALVQTAFDLWTAYKGTNAKDTGNCDRLLSLGNN